MRIPALRQKSILPTTYVSPQPARNSLNGFVSSVSGRYILLERRMHSKMRRKARRAAPAVDESEGYVVE